MEKSKHSQLIVFYNTDNSISFKINKQVFLQQDLKSKLVINILKRNLYIIYKEIANLLQRNQADQQFKLFESYCIWFKKNEKIKRTTKPVVFFGCSKNNVLLFRNKFTKFLIKKEDLIKFNSV